MRSTEGQPEPWRSFFNDLDRALTEQVSLHCCGGFVVTQLYGVARTTSDVDFLGAVPNMSRYLVNVAGRGSSLHRKHHVYLDAVTVATPPEDYEERMIGLYPATWRYLRLWTLEAHDIALSKLERNSERDRYDVQQLAKAGHLNPETLRERYYREVRPNLLAHETRHDLTLKLWLEAYWT